MPTASVSMRSAALALGAFGLVVGSVSALAHFRGIPQVPVAAAATGDAPAAVQVAPLKPAATSASVAGPTPPFADLDLTHEVIDAQEVTAPLGKRTAHLTVDPRLQRSALSLIKQHKLPEAAIVMMDPETGAILVWASHVDASERHRSPRYDFAASAIAPSASVFKIVTAATLVEHDGLGPQTRECIARSAEQRILASDLVDDPLRDKWCMTLATAMGKSENAVFARLAHRRLDPATLGQMAHAFGYGEAVAFDLPVQPGELRLPDEPLPFARTAAGFWNTTLSPIHAAYISAIVARGGSAIRPVLVRRVTSGATVDYESPAPVSRGVIRPETAQALATMMEHTVSEGTSYRAFHDAHRRPFLPVQAAGKTGTLNDPDGQHLYTWFTGFAPAHGTKKEVVIAVLVVNRPRWHVKANVVAREMLRDYFREEARPVASR
jgi:peptidoglycan glycosyltransferase